MNGSTNVPRRVVRLLPATVGVLVVGVLALTACGPDKEGTTLPGAGVARESGCVACHSVSGGSGVGPTWKGLAGSQVALADGSTVTADEAYLKESIISPDAKVVKGFAPGIMPKGFGDKLKPDQIDALIEYMKTLK